MSSFFAHMKTKVVSILAATFFATACEATKEQSQVDQTRVMSGYIDQDFSNELLIAMREGEDLVVTSGRYKRRGRYADFSVIGLFPS